MLGNVSYRLKVPLMMSITIILTSLVVSVALTWRAYGDLREDLYRNAIAVGGILSNTLPSALKHDDLWLAYQLVAAAKSGGETSSDSILIVLDNDYRMYVSNQPRRFPVLSELSQLSPELARVEKAVRRASSLKPYPFETPENDNIYTIIPMVSDGVALGTLVMGYPRSLFLPKFYAIVQRVAYSALLVLTILLPLGWYLGNRAVKPLTQLATCMSKVGSQPPDEVQCTLSEGKDEIGRLGVSFRQMLNELQEKQRLERQMIASERLAAVGRLAAGVAHEINNPLGGMLNAISTFRHHGQSGDLTGKTLSLLERGLKQIGDTVSALLVEVRPESHALTPEDIEDVYTLLQPHAQERSVVLRWDNSLTVTIALPSTQVRQVLINLFLNAVQAAPEGGVVSCIIRVQGDRLRISVDNEGEIISPDGISQLFEPFVYHNPAGNGLGLWVTYQIVQQLEGGIEVDSGADHTRFTVELPLALAA